MLKISAATVAHAIAHAREREAVVDSWENRVEQAFHDEPASAVLYDFATAWGGGNLAEFISNLDEDEQASLLAIAWIGRGTFSPDNVEEAVVAAKSGPVYHDHLLSTPLLADYLCDGVEKLGEFAPLQ
jgi:hypothetical protein